MTTSIQDALLASTDRELQGEGGGYIIPHEPHAGQRPLLESQARFRVIVAHRRWGKNWACIFDALRRVRQLAEEAGRERLSPRVVVWFVFPTYVLADELWLDLRRMVPAAWIERTLESKPMRMELRGDIHISIRSAENPEHLVGAGIDLLYMIEAARIKEGAWEAVRPTLTSAGRAGLAVFNSTPKGRNWFSRIWARCGDPDQPDWEGWRIPAFLDDQQTRHPLSIIPDTDRILAERKENRANWFAQEYMAQFVGGEGQVFRNVREHVAAPPSPPAAPVTAGVDLAKVVDFTVFAAFDSAGRMVAMDRMHGISYPQQSARLCHFLDTHKVKTVAVESNGPGEAFIDILKSDLYDAGVQCQVVDVATTAQSKEQMVHRLAVALEKGSVSVLNDPVLIEELEAYEVTKTPAGNEKYGAPEGEHDDCVMACALALTQLKRTAPRPPGTLPTQADANRIRARRSTYGGGLYDSVRRHRR